jgi:alpha-D-ribose 1-methylphosphonate 5-triphosphate synthase subunit PhnG
MLDEWACIFERHSGGTRTARWCAIMRWPRMCAMPRRAMSRRAWCTVSASADRLDKVVLERLVSSIRRVLAEESGISVVDGAIGGTGAGGIEIEAIFELGVVHVARALWDKLGIGVAIASKVYAKKLKAPHLAALLAMANPATGPARLKAGLP